MRRIQVIHAFAGLLVLLSSILGATHSVWWLFLSGFVGLNLFQYAFTDWCLLEKVLKKLGVPE